MTSAFPEAITLAGLDLTVTQRAVSHTSELDRILAIPRRRWDEGSPEVARLTLEMSAWLRVPGSTATLRPSQAVALCELYYLRRLFGPMPVGSGKTLVTFLAPTVFSAKRPVLVLPANLRDEKTPRDFARYAKDWRAPATLPLISYEQLSRDYGTETRVVWNVHAQMLPGACTDALARAYEMARQPVLARFDATTRTWDVTESSDGTRVVIQLRDLGLLDLLNPDLIICDESHRLKSTKAACTRKMARFMAEHSDVAHIDLSGTITKDSVKDYAHLLYWTHRHHSPLPTPNRYRELCDWAGALDVNVRAEDRLSAGALVELCAPEDYVDAGTTTAARRGFRRRLIETPGIVASPQRFEGASLLIREVAQPLYGKKTEEVFKALREKGELPNGDRTAGGLDDWRHERTMARGFFAVWDPPPPAPWLFARTEWHANVRRVIAENRKGLDSTWQVAHACTLPSENFRGEMWDCARAAYAYWKAVEDTYAIRTRVVWFDDAAIEFVKKWMRENVGLVWVEHVAFGDRLSGETGAPYFRESGFSARGDFVEDAKPDGGSIILSIESNGGGRNLQHWSNNFFVNLPRGGHRFEQAIGRTHRSGQVADQVVADVALWCAADFGSWRKILDEAPYSSDTTSLPAKVLYADLVMPDAAEVNVLASQSARFLTVDF